MGYKALMSANAPHLEALNIVSLREHIKRQIIDAILSGVFRPGERLVEATIADQLGVSRAPVREALVALEQEGIVTSLPRRGYFVINFSRQDIEEIYSLRLLLEEEALRRAVGHFPETALRQMQAIVDLLGVPGARGEALVELIGLDHSFHEHIVRTAHHSRLYSAWDSMRVQTWLLIGLTSRTHFDYPDQPREWHQRILNAIVAGDIAEATAALHDHILDAEGRAQRAWQQLVESTTAA